MKRITIVSVHPDDETLGCGGTLLRHGRDGDELSWVIVTSPWEPRYSAELMARKTAEIERVAAAYGMARVIRLQLPTMRLREVPLNDVMQGLQEAFDQTQPEWLYTVHGGDIHTDHRVAFDAVMSVAKPFRSRGGVQRILSFETLSSTDAAPAEPWRQFTPTRFVEVTPFLEQKIRIMALFESEQQPEPLPRAASSIRALARQRGATIGCEYAEAFMVLRDVDVLEAGARG